MPNPSAAATPSANLGRYRDGVSRLALTQNQSSGRPTFRSPRSCGLLRPLLLALLHLAREVLAVLVVRRRELGREAVDRPRRALLHEIEDVADFLLAGGNGRGATVAVHDRLVRLARGNEVHAVLRDLLVGPEHVLESEQVERE